MLSMMPQSPSSLKLFADCPWQYMGRYIRRWYTFEDNEYTRRGTEIHGYMEEMVRSGEAKWPAREAPVMEYGISVLDTLCLPELRDRGWTVTPELEAAASWDGKPTDWNARDAFVRSRIDLCMASPDGRKIIIVDWKTGKTPADKLQLQMNALTLAQFRDPARSYRLLFVYLDLRKMVSLECPAPDVRYPMVPTVMDYNRAARSPFRRTWETLLDCIAAHRDNRFEKRRGAGCRWCKIKARCVAGDEPVAELLKP
jgi:RecB family exonuclease